MTPQAKTTAKQRLVFIDWIRAVGILYVVAFWHGFEWVRGEPFHITPVTTALKFTALGLFVFVSGYLLGRQPIDLTARGLMQFYRRRLLRIWPLYAVALLVFFFLGLADADVAWRSAFGISLFWGPAPLTLWFVAMLLSYYVLAPFLVTAASRSTLHLIVASGVLLAVIVVLKTALPHGDSRIVLYFPTFVLGIWWSCKARPLALPTIVLLMLAGCLCFIAVSCSDVRGLNTLLYIGFIGCASFGVFALCQRHAERFPAYFLVAAVSFASFAMYLFHRPIIIGMTAFYFPASAQAQIAYLWLIVLPVIIAASWLAQFLYDRFPDTAARVAVRL